MGLLVHVFSVACTEWKLIPTNPALLVRKPKIIEKRVRYLSAWERQRLLHAAKNCRVPCMYALIVLALDTGARKTELLNLKWSDVDIGNQRILIWRRKNHRPHTVPISDFCLEVIVNWHQELGEYIEEAEYVFVTMEGKKQYIKDVWYEILKKAELTNFKFHHLRSSCAVDILNAGGSLMAVKQILGHESINSTMVYSTLAESSLNEVIQRSSSKFKLAH